MMPKDTRIGVMQHYLDILLTQVGVFETVISEMGTDEMKDRCRELLKDTEEIHVDELLKLINADY